MSTKIHVTLKGISDEGSVLLASEKIDLKIKTESAVFPLSGVIIVENLVLPSQKINKNLSNLCFSNTNVRIKPYDQSPDLVIGQDHSNLIISREFREVITNK